MVLITLEPTIVLLVSRTFIIFVLENIECGPRKFDFDNVFLVDDGREDSSTTTSGPSSARQQNAIKLGIIKWRFAGVPMMAQH